MTTAEENKPEFEFLTLEFVGVENSNTSYIFSQFSPASHYILSTGQTSHVTHAETAKKVSTCTLVMYLNFSPVLTPKEPCNDQRMNRIYEE
jgi:hypothetical protein